MMNGGGGRDGCEGCEVCERFAKGLRKVVSHVGPSSVSICRESVSEPFSTVKFDTAYTHPSHPRRQSSGNVKSRDLPKHSKTPSARKELLQTLGPTAPPPLYTHEPALPSRPFPSRHGASRRERPRRQPRRTAFPLPPLFKFPLPSNILSSPLGFLEPLLPFPLALFDAILFLELEQVLLQRQFSGSSGRLNGEESSDVE